MGGLSPSLPALRPDNLARLAALNGFDLVAVADEERIRDASKDFTKLGANVRAVEADLSTEKGVEAVYDAATVLAARSRRFWPTRGARLATHSSIRTGAKPRA